MVNVTQAALKERARTLLVAMTERSRWVYALPKEGSFDAAKGIIAEAGLAAVAEEADGKVVKYDGDDGAGLVLFDARAELGAVLLQGRSDAVVPLMQQI